MYTVVVKCCDKLCSRCTVIDYYAVFAAHRNPPYDHNYSYYYRTVPYRTYCGTQRHDVHCTYIVTTYIYIYGLACIGRTQPACVTRTHRVRCFVVVSFVVLRKLATAGSLSLALPAVCLYLCLFVSLFVCKLLCVCVCVSLFAGVCIVFVRMYATLRYARTYCIALHCCSTV